MAKYAYLLSMEDTFYMNEHPYNPKVVKVRRLCVEIVALEERAELLRTELAEAVRLMSVASTGRVKRARRGK